MSIRILNFVFREIILRISQFDAFNDLYDAVDAADCAEYSVTTALLFLYVSVCVMSLESDAFQTCISV